MERINIIESGILGTVVGDALGVPVEFSSRAERDRDPVTDMREYGTHHQPKGTWSDDSSLMLATMDSMIQRKGILYDDIMKRFKEWKFNAEYTPHGRVFDIGITCSNAISQYRNGRDPLKCGERGERDNGNGSLMRIMPISLYFALLDDYWDIGRFVGAVETIQEASCLTHAHPRSQMACVLYSSICHELIYRGDRSPEDAVNTAITKTLDFYDNAAKGYEWCDAEFREEIEKDTYCRIREASLFKTTPEGEISSSGYVVHTLEAAIWCLLNSKSYSDCVLKAVNLGDDTDTVGAVAGGLAGLLYGYDNIPKDWIGVIVSREWIEGLCFDFNAIM